MKAKRWSVHKFLRRNLICIRNLARKGHALNTLLLEMTEHTWAPSTVLVWHRQLIAEKYDSTGPNQKKRSGQPISGELRQLIIEMGKCRNPIHRILQQGATAPGFGRSHDKSAAARRRR